MKPDSSNRATSRFSSIPLAFAAALALALPLQALAAGVELATVPMATSTTSTVKPNLMFVLDDSGSMYADYLPDDVSAYANKYGFNSPQCNGNTYNPSITYTPPVNSTGAPLNATPTTFAAAYRDGYNPKTYGSVNLSTGFMGGTGIGSSSGVLKAGPAFYYSYSGTQTTAALKNYSNSSSTFYQECNSNIGSSPGSSVFTKVRLAAIPTTTITIGGTPGATITVTTPSVTQSKFSSVQVSGAGGGEIMSGTTGVSNSASTSASRIATNINACTASTTGSCTVAGYSATTNGSIVTVVGPAASGATLTVTLSGGNATTAVTAFPAITSTTVSSITVNSIELLQATTGSQGSFNSMASAINTQINARTATSGFSSTVSNNIVTVTGPISASLFTPSISASGGNMAFLSPAFPENTPAKLLNFANWYSYYSNRMMMMKTGAGLAFNNVSDKFRVGFITMNNTVSPGIVEVNTFDAAQRGKWFNALYAARPSGSTPLREILSKVGQYYAHKFGAVTSYKATITVGVSGTTGVDGITVGGTEIMNDGTDDFDTTSALAAAIADQINRKVITDYGASVSGSVITITGIASSFGKTIVVTKNGGMSFTIGNFAASTSTSTLNGIAPADPIEYSCQQNFTILSTDGYWNGATTYSLSGGTVGQVDGFAKRPYNDGAQENDTVQITYTRNSWTSVNCALGQTPVGGKRAQRQPQKASCTKMVPLGTSPTGTESCTPASLSWVSNGAATFGGCDATNPAVIPAPNPTTIVEIDRVVTVGASGGYADTLSDVALYYYQTDLRNNSLGNCSGALGTNVCENNVFISGKDNNLQQHMTTFTLGLGVQGKMVYSTSYLTDTTGDFVAVKLGSTTDLTPKSTLLVTGTGSTVVNSITVNGVTITSGASTASTSTSTVAANIAAKISAGGFTATASGATVTITAPASALDQPLVISQTGSMVLSASTVAKVCSWQSAGTVCNWPPPFGGTSSTVDDLWHTAVNGRGAYFSATDPESLASALANALTSINSKIGTAAAAATSTLNPVAGNNQAFVASYTTQTWAGNLEARGINTSTGVVNQNASWCVENVTASSCLAPGVVTADSSGDVTAYFCVTPSSVTCAGGDLDGTDCRIPISTNCVGTMNAKVTDTSDTRTIYTAAHNSTVNDVPIGSSGVAITNGTALVPFNTAFRSVNPTYFDATVAAGLSQWPPASDTSSGAVYFRANAHGDNLLKFLRGQHGHEVSRNSVASTDQWYRNRESVLGDALESQPAFIGAPIFSYPYPGYSEYLTAQASRAGTVYMGTNDGMMHAFAANTGIELWAYIPSMIIPNMWKLADQQYKDKHTNYVNGSPTTTDVCTLRCSNVFTSGSPNTSPVWKTIMVSGLNGGGRGFIALDITDPTTPSLLWEFSVPTANGGIGTVRDADLGYTFGQPVVTQKSDGTWVVLVTSGYDNGTDSPTRVSGNFVANSPAGTGQGYLYVLNAGTGAIISKISTGAGTADTPSGLAKIAGYNAEPGGNKVSYVYGGDLLGNLWRFDINASTAAGLGSGNIGNGSVLKFATLFSDSAATLPQPVMTTPILGTIVGKRVIFIGTGKYLEIPDLSNTQKMTQYGIKDDDATTTFVNPRTSLVQQFLIPNPDGTATRLVGTAATSTSSGTNPVDFGTGRGWFTDLPDSRERINIDAKLVLGTLIVPSIVPSSTSCSPGGSGWLNFLDYTTGASVNNVLAGVKYDSTIVGVNVLFIGGNPVVEVVTSTDPTPTKDEIVQFKASSTGFSGKRVSWRELIPAD